MCTCARCGAAIKNVYEWQGKNYGSECVTIVSGIKKWELKQVEGGNVEEYLTKQAEKVSKMVAENEVRQERIAHFTKINGWLINFLEQFADPHKRNYNSFASGMIVELCRKEVKDLSEKQFDALQNIWAYGYTGLDEGYVRAEFIIASGIEDTTNQEVITECKYFVLSYATQKELKELAKENKVKGYSKMTREQLEDSLIEYINL